MSDVRWRLLLSGPATGAWNMAVDEALLQAIAAGSGIPTLRFYGWAPPCLSLGYFQPFDVVDVAACRARGVDIVRRPTGGRAILHDRELTYSVTLPASLLGEARGILPSYYRISRALQSGLRQLGVSTTLAPESAALAVVDRGPSCFDRASAHEILLNGRKLVGSAQVRKGSALLQHGSILIEPRIDVLMACLGFAADAASDGLADAVAGLAEVGVAEADQIAAAVATGVAREFDGSLISGQLTAEEVAAAEELLAGRYRSADWTRRPLPSMAEKTTRTR
jgi:lipoyl(octanoyl) transferase